MFTIFAGVYFWFPKMTGRMYDERLGKWHFWLTFVSFNATFFPMHYVGLRGMPRRVSDYSEAFGDLNFFITVASFVLGASFVIFAYNIILSWVRGPVAGDNPWRAHSLEWQVSSPPPIFNFDEIPQVVGGPYEYGVPGARHAVMSAAKRGAAGGARMSGESAVLVVANETLTGDALIAAVRRRAERGPIRAVVVAPVSTPREGYVVYRDSRRAAAGRRLERTLQALRATGIPAHGAVFDDEPLAAVKDILSVEDVDEIIVSTHPETKSGWLRKNLIDEIRKVAGDRPVEHVVADVATSEGVNVLVVANETVLGDALLDRIRARAKEAPASFLIVSPQSDPSRGEHPEAERRLRAALATLRSEGIDVHGQVAHPDPYTAAMQRDLRRADGRDHRLDLPRRALRAGSVATSSAASARTPAFPSSTSSTSPIVEESAV